jgi:predicted enzyme related to lactoylglutathione lyase
VLGWGWGGGDDYPEAQVGGRTIAGLMPRRPGMPAGVPDNWLVYFGTSDVDADVPQGDRPGRQRDRWPG